MALPLSALVIKMLGLFFIKCLVFSKSILNFLSLYEQVDNSLLWYFFFIFFFLAKSLKLGEKFNFNNTFDIHLTLQHQKNFETYVNNYIDDEIAPKVRGSFLDTIKKYHHEELSTRSYSDKNSK